MTEFAGKVPIPRETEVKEDPLGRKVLVVKNLDGFPQADNQRQDPGIYPRDSGGRVLVVKPAKNSGAKGHERLDPNNRNWPCG